MTLVPLPAFADNYIWMLQDGRDAIVVDPGDAEPVFDALGRGDLQLAAILVTHHTPIARRPAMRLCGRVQRRDSSSHSVSCNAKQPRPARCHAAAPWPAALRQWKNDFR